MLWFNFIFGLKFSKPVWFEYITIIMIQRQKYQIAWKNFQQRKNWTTTDTCIIKHKLPGSVFWFSRTTAVWLYHSVLTVINRCLAVLKFPVQNDQKILCSQDTILFVVETYCRRARCYTCTLIWSWQGVFLWRVMGPKFLARHVMDPN